MYGRRLLWLVLAFVGVLLLGCRGAQGEPGPVGPAGAPGPMGPVGPAGSDATASQGYVGSEQCGQCHDSAYSKFVLSGHPYPITKIENGQRSTIHIPHLPIAAQLLWQHACDQFAYRLSGSKVALLALLLYHSRMVSFALLLFKKSVRFI